MKIENEFIPFEQALALKELGFDEKCLASFYTHVDENFVLGKYDYRRKFNINYSDDDDYIVNTDKTHYISAPLYQQAFRWLWNKTGKYIIPIQKDDKEWLAIGIVYKTYEEAEIECLKKLIEIVKSKL